jgi:hypothetical protein
MSGLCAAGLNRVRANDAVTVRYDGNSAYGAFNGMFEWDVEENDSPDLAETTKQSFLSAIEAPPFVTRRVDTDAYVHMEYNVSQFIASKVFK